MAMPWEDSFIKEIKKLDAAREAQLSVQEADEVLRPRESETGIEIRFSCGDKEIIPKKPVPPVWETCLCCEAKFDLSNLHPGHVKYFGEHPKLCRRCGLCFGPYGSIWSKDLESRIIDAKKRAGLPRRCFVCGNSFNLLGSFYRHMWYKDDNYPDLLSRNANPAWGDWVSTGGLDFLYPNLYTAICPECFQDLFWQHIEHDPQSQLDAVRELGERLGKLPVRNFHSYIYACQDKAGVESFLMLLKRLPDPELINVRFGSYFKLLLLSGLLPKGTRRMRLGTWTLAKDGDMCFSLVERDIDDWLTRHKIKHTKEVKYPGTEMRCDWEVFRDGQRIFIEYFGLMNQETYAAKAEQKRQLAMANGIRLIGITPETDWESCLMKELE